MLLLIIESLSGEPLIEEDYNSKKTAKERRRTALIAGTSVGLGALLLASLLVGGTLIATNGDSSKIPLNIIMRMSIYSYTFKSVILESVKIIIFENI